MTDLQTLVHYANKLLAITDFQDCCPNGLQLEGKPEVRKLVSGVTASQALIDAAVAADADVLLVHHGYFWKGEDPRIIGMKRRRLASLLQTGVSLLAYHLPLDAHTELGNNAQLARVLGLSIDGRFGQDSGLELGFRGTLTAALSPQALLTHIEQSLGRVPLHLPGSAAKIKSLGWCTGAAQSYIEQAAALGLDAFISGEVSEQTAHVARECGIHYFAAGHHATERYGVQALGEHLAQNFELEHEFIDIDNPV